MRIFAKWFYGFNPVTWPCVSLSGNGAAHFRRNVLPGDVVAFVGANRAPTPAEDRGRLLGMATVSDRERLTLDLVLPEFLGDRQFNDRGEMRWPAAFAMLQAWHFPGKPRIEEVIGRQLSPKCRMYVDEFTAEEACAVLALAVVPEAVADTPQRTADLEETEAALGGKLSVGPVPSRWTALVMHGLDRPATTYAFRFGETDVWKIGWALDPSRRLAEINRHVPVEVLGVQWHAVLSSAQASPLAARELEQKLLGLLSGHRTTGERLLCAFDAMQEAWHSCHEHATSRPYR